MVPSDTDTDEAFLRQLVLPEEDRLRLYPTVQWAGGYRWFRSPNVIPIEQWRNVRVAPPKERLGRRG
jgi:hypothetical protein